ncbi:MAG TPA: S41 family peptidase [Pyrinomonadaceae bacterium]|nr:S41 family peptidase [Pyrinomonadaceae bacterium]
MQKSRHLHKQFWLYIFLLPLAFHPFTLARADSSVISTATREGRLAVFDDVWETIRDRYYDPAFHGVDWQALRAEFRTLAADAQSTAQFYTVLRRMIGLLGDAHTRVYAPEERFDWQRPRFISIGISVREVAGAPTVVALERGSEAERAGLRPGDVLLSVDGEPAHAVFTRSLKERSGSQVSAAARLQAMAALFDGPHNSMVRVAWISVDGKQKEVSLRREWREREPVLRVQRVSGGYDVVEFNLFTQAVATGLVRALGGKLRGSRGLILDLRSNGGGEAEAMTEVASAFLPAGKSLGRFTDRSGRIVFEPQTRAAMLFASDSIRRFNGPVVILTSEKTSSAAEIFVAAMLEARRATVIGGPTCGCVLAIRRPHRLPDGGELNISELDYRSAVGMRLEGQGITPDENVSLNKKDLRARLDRAVERAIERLKVDERAR